MCHVCEGYKISWSNRAAALYRVGLWLTDYELLGRLEAEGIAQESSGAPGAIPIDIMGHAFRDMGFGMNADLH